VDGDFFFSSSLSFPWRVCEKEKERQKGAEHFAFSYLLDGYVRQKKDINMRPE